MSLKIQEQPGPVWATDPVAPVTLSERVEGRRPQGQQRPQPDLQQAPPPEPQQTAADAPLPDHDEPEMSPSPEQEQVDVIVPREQLEIRHDAGADDRRQERRWLPPADAKVALRAALAVTPRPAGGMPRSMLAGAHPAVASLPGSAAPMLPAAPVAGGASPTVSALPLVTVAPAPVAPPSTAAVVAAGGVVESAPGQAAAGEAGNRAPAMSAPTSRPSRGQAVPASPATDARAAAAVDSTPGQGRAGQSPQTLPAAERPSTLPDAPTAAVTTTTVMPQQQEGNAGVDGQVLADARRAEANLGTRQHVRAARQAEALQTAMAARADTASKVTASKVSVSFNSWGAGNSVTARLDGGRLYMQPSNARVAQALSSASAPPGAELHIAVESSDSATDERRRRGGDQGHA